jgi:hypothetical protein
MWDVHKVMQMPWSPFHYNPWFDLCQGIGVEGFIQGLLRYKKTLKHLKNLLAQTWNLTWNLKLLITWKTFLAYTSILKVITLNNSKNSLPHFFKLQRWNPQQLEELSFTHFELKTWNLKTWRTFFDTWDPITLWRNLFHTSHSFEKVASSLYATTWKWTFTHFAN